MTMAMKKTAEIPHSSDKKGDILNVAKQADKKKMVNKEELIEALLIGKSKYAISERDIAVLIALLRIHEGDHISLASTAMSNMKTTFIELTSAIENTQPAEIRASLKALEENRFIIRDENMIRSLNFSNWLKKMEFGHGIFVNFQILIARSWEIFENAASEQRSEK